MAIAVKGESSLPLFQDKLISQLKARPALANVSIVTGPPSPGVASGERWIAFVEAKGLETWAALGRLAKEENYTQTVYISVLTRDGEGSAKIGRDLAYSYRSEIGKQLIADPTVGMTVWQCQVAEKQEFFPRLGINVPDANGHPVVDLSWREAALFMDITVKYRT